MLSMNVSPFGERTQKYWDKRHKLFSKWDEGVLTDEEGLYSVMPEEFAMKVGRLLRGEIVLDAFCGIGGSSIAFARSGKNVIAIDINEARLKMAQHNARIYGVEDRICFVHGDALSLYDHLGFDAVNLEPPWGGPDYSKKSTFNWSDFSPNPLHLAKKAVDKKVSLAVGLPKNFSDAELKLLQSDFYIDEAWDGVRLLFKTAYFPPPAQL